MIGSLFDFSFSKFVTTSLIRILYVIGFIANILIAIVLFVLGAVLVVSVQDSFLLGVFFIILSPIAFLLLTILLRVQLEVVIVIFRIAEYLREMAGREPRPPQ